MAEYIIIRRHQHEVPDRSPIEDAVYCKIKGENHYIFDLCKVDVVKKQLVLQEPFAGAKEFELAIHRSIPDAGATVLQMLERHNQFDSHDRILIVELEDYINEIIADYELNVYPKLEKIYGAPPCPRVPIPCSPFAPEDKE